MTPTSYDANNRIQASPTPGGGADTTYLFDADGNVGTRTSPSATATFGYDKTHRLRSWSDGSATASYVYDPFGRRIRKTVSGVTTWYLWDGDQLLVEYDGTGTRAKRYAYGGGFAPLQVAEGAPGAETIYDVHTDHLDTPRMLTDSSGTPVWKAAYQAFGEAHLDPANTVAGFNIRFPGQYYDAETGLHYNRFRYYSPELGRYISADPIGQAGGYNVYQYVGAQPTRWADPFGLEEGSPENRRKRRAIDRIARGHEGSTDWAYGKRKDDFPADQNKCNKFVNDVTAEAGAPTLITTPGGTTRGPLAGEIANPDEKIPNWRPLDPDEEPEPGDIAAFPIDPPQPGATGHSGIITSSPDGGTSNESAHYDSVGPRENQFKGNPRTTFRRYTGD